MLMIFDFLIFAALAAVAVTLALGVVNMARRDEDSPRRSNVLMRWRVGLQFVALIVLVLAFIARRSLAG
ncbi:MAG: twin transmembrane helix small protein [Maricaulaceae bacterium]|nr:twin transmembrane helix small protein [Maricaulaceae bacterium]